MSVATIVAVAAETAEHGNVQAQTFIYGAVAFVVFMAIGLVTLSFRNVANRHAPKAEAYARTHAAELPEGHGHH